LALIAVIAGIWLLQVAQAVFVPLVLSVLVAHSLEPAVKALQRLWLPRWVAAALPLLLLTGVLGYGAYSLSDEAIAVIDSIPPAARQLRRTLASQDTIGTDGVIEKVQRAANEIEKTATEAAGGGNTTRGVPKVQVERPPIDVRDYLWWGSSSLAAFVTQVALILFFVYFFLLSGDLFKRKLVKLAGPSLARRRTAVQVLEEISAQIERFLLVQLSACILVALLSWAAFWWIGLERATIWALAMGLLVLIPYLGALVATSLIGLAAYIQFANLETTILLMLLAFGIRGLETLLLTPWLMGRVTRMNGVIVFGGLLFWGWLWGVWGLLLAVPMMVVIKSTCDRIGPLQPIGELMGE
jgi:predicted PurR-regulated permease PerM